MTTIQSKRTTLSPLLVYLLNHIHTANGVSIHIPLHPIESHSLHLELSSHRLSLHSKWSLSTVQLDCFTFFQLETPFQFHDPFHSFSSRLWRNSRLSFESAPFLTRNQHFALGAAQRVVRLPESTNRVELYDRKAFWIAGYSLFPQWELFQPIVVSVMRLFPKIVLKSLVIDCLEVLNRVLTEPLLLMIDPEVRNRANLQIRIRRICCWRCLIEFESRISIIIRTITYQKCVITASCCLSRCSCFSLLCIFCCTTAAIISNWATFFALPWWDVGVGIECRKHTTSAIYWL